MANQQLLLGVGASKKTYIEDVFSIDEYFANTGNYINVVNGIDLAGEGGMIWGHRRDNDEDHVICDTERGTLKYMTWHDSQAPETSHGYSAYNSNGFTVNNASRGAVNQGNGANYEGRFCTRTFRKAKGFFDVVKWDGNDSSNRQIAHNLGTYPGMIIVKAYYGGAMDWCIYHVSMGKTKHLILNSISGPSTSNTVWNDTAPTDTHFTVGSNSKVNESGRSYVAYLFGGASGTGTSHHVFGDTGDKDIIKCGSYTGNSDSGTNGAFCNLGWEPQLVIIKRNGSGHWKTIDAFRGTCQEGLDQEEELSANNKETENPRLDFYANGFRLRTTASDYNTASNEYFYMAIRREDGHVGKPQDTGSDVFNVAAGRPTDLPHYNNSGWDADMSFIKKTNGTESWYLGSRINNKYFLSTDGTGYRGSWNGFDYSWESGWGNVAGYTGSNYTGWQFKRHKGFDVVNWYGNGGNRDHPHGLAQTPEMIWIKCTSHTKDWVVGHIGMNGGTNPWHYYLKLNETNSGWDDNTIFADSAPGATNFSTGGDDKVNASGLRYTGFLFASVPGVSKVGYYTGSGAMTVTTGFQPRFVLIKNVSQSYNRQWLVLDTSRGWGSGNDYYIVLNSSSQHYTHDFGAPTSTGFTLTDHIWCSTSGDNFIYYAHA